MALAPVQHAALVALSARAVGPDLAHTLVAAGADVAVGALVTAALRRPILPSLTAHRGGLGVRSGRHAVGLELDVVTAPQDRHHHHHAPHSVTVAGLASVEMCADSEILAGRRAG